MDENKKLKLELEIEELERQIDPVSLCAYTSGGEYETISE